MVPRPSWNSGTAWEARFDEGVHRNAQADAWPRHWFQGSSRRDNDGGDRPVCGDARDAHRCTESARGAIAKSPINSALAAKRACRPSAAASFAASASHQNDSTSCKAACVQYGHATHNAHCPYNKQCLCGCAQIVRGRISLTAFPGLGTLCAHQEFAAVAADRRTGDRRNKTGWRR